MFIAPHLGRESGICPALLDDYGCKPKLVIISDDYLQHDIQATPTTATKLLATSSSPQGRRGTCR